MQVFGVQLTPSILSNLALVVVIFILDLVTKLGTPVWIGYILAFFFIPGNVPQRYPLALATICTVLMLVGYLLSSEGTLEPLSQRGIIIIVLWIYAMVLTRRKHEEDDQEES